MEANESKYLSIKEFISLPMVSDVDISSDGENVAFIKRTADWKDNEFKNQIWIYENSKKECRPLSKYDMDVVCPSWTPDSRHVAYISTAMNDGKSSNQVFVHSIDDDHIIQATNDSEGVSKFKWEPDDNGIYYIARTKQSVEHSTNKDTYESCSQAGKEYRNNCLYYINNTGINKKEDIVVNQLTNGNDFNIYDFDISNDGKSIALVVAPTPFVEDNRKIYIY